MRLELSLSGLDVYRSLSQRARVATEAWAETNLYCVNCPSNNLERATPNTPAVDYTCPRCGAPFQLKSQRRPFSHRLTDAAYEAMRRAIEQDRTPNLFVLHYQPERWTVWNLILVPRFAFSFSLLERRKPLSPKAQRAGWVGCNILLGNVPVDARIWIVTAGNPIRPEVVRRRYARLRPLAKLSHERRGWTLDVLNVVRSLDKREFSLADVYAYKAELAELHQSNRYIEAKVRQQLQVLRDLGFLEFLGGGRYRLR